MTIHTFIMNRLSLPKGMEKKLFYAWAYKAGEEKLNDIIGHPFPFPYPTDMTIEGCILLWRREESGDTP